jgi:hypothetical protein
MAGLNRGLTQGMFIGCRVATQLGCDLNKRQVRYVPGYTNTSGKAVQAKCTVTAFVNDDRGNATTYDFVMWGKLADAAAKSLSPGKEFHCLVAPESYLGRVWDKTGNLVTNPDGTELKVRKTNYKITKMIFGADAQKFVDYEIQNRLRPVNWNDGGAGTEAWKTLLKAKHAYVYDGVSPEFGYAKVISPSKSMNVGSPTPSGTEINTDNPALAAQIASILKQMNGGSEGTEAKTAAGGTDRKLF